MTKKQRKLANVARLFNPNHEPGGSPIGGEFAPAGGDNEPPVQSSAGGKVTYEMQKAQATAFLDKVESEDSTFSRWAGNVLSSMSNQPGKLFDENEPRVPSGPDAGEWTSGGGGTNHEAGINATVRDGAHKVDHPPNAPSLKVRQLADQYRLQNGLDPNDSGYKHVDPALAANIADAYDAMQHNPGDAATKASYDAFKAEVSQQWNAAQAAGFKFEPWTKTGQPYADSAAMVKDVTENGHLYFFRGGEMPSDHPMAAQAGGGLTYNDKFRAIHDLFAHAGTGNAFGARGEFNAFLEHASMFTPQAVSALATETLGQNSWVNYGKHIRGVANPPDAAHRPYAQQKAGLLPRALIEQARRRTSLSEENLSDDFSSLDEVISRWSERLGLNPAEAAKLGEDFKAQAFTMADVWNERFLTAIKDSLEDAIALGQTAEEWKQDAQDIIDSYSVDPYDDIQGAYGDLVFRQATINAQAAGRYASMFSDRNMVNDPYWQFTSVEDDRLDEECAALDGMVFSKNDEESRSFLPPIHFNCRCVAIPMDESEVSDGEFDVSEYSDATMTGADGNEIQVEPAPGFGGDKVKVFVPGLLKQIGGLSELRDVSDEPRDEKGRWTEGSVSAAVEAASTATPADITAGKVPHVVMGDPTKVGSQVVGQYQGDGTVHVYPGFFAMDKAGRSGLMWHEFGHEISGRANADGTEKWVEALRPFRLKPSDPWSYDNFAGGSSRPEEFMADIYSLAMMSKKQPWDSQSEHDPLLSERRYSLAYRFVLGEAQKARLPLPRWYVAK